MKTFIYPYVAYSQHDSEAEEPGLIHLDANNVQEADTLIKEKLIAKLGPESFPELIEDDDQFTDFIGLEHEAWEFDEGYILGIPMCINGGTLTLKNKKVG